MTDNTAQTDFPMYEARALVRDLMKPDPFIYWSDFLFHNMTGWVALLLALWAPSWSIWQVGAYFIAVFAFYRAAIFVHELAHLERGTFRLFRLVWNITCGIPFMIPSFTYDGVHYEHHKPGIYGTSKDGEYLPFATQRPVMMVGYVLLSLLLPLLLVMRFLLLTPLSYFSPAIRKIVWERASSLTINPAYLRARDTVRNDQHWRLQEFATFLFAFIIIACVFLGFLPYQLLVLWYAIAVMIFIFNSLRTLAAHAYRHSDDHPLTLVEQYLDSINVPGNWLTALWAPVGLRYHATHHLFMSMPYHNLGKAQRRLSQAFQDNSLIKQTSRDGLWSALSCIWQEAACSSSDKKTGRQE
ncbi:MAG: fatty acid desaturase [Nitrosomonas sp.]|nr:fatty acid desaturase [Nitrosomonas sp.]